NLLKYSPNFYLPEEIPQRQFDLVISNWCLSEFDEAGIEFYFEKVIKNCQFAYILGNAWDERKQFILDLAAKYFSNIEIFPEYPKTSIYPNWKLILKK